MTMAIETRTKLLQTGLDLLSSDGLSGLSLGRIAAASKMSKSGLFAHFRSKDQLSIELLDAGASLARTYVAEPAMEYPEGIARLRALVGFWLGWSARAGLSGGCPVAAALFELDDLKGPVRDHVHTLEKNWRGLLSTLVEGAIECGELPRDVDVEQFVFELCGLYLSHHASSRFLRDPDADQRAQRAFEALLERLEGKDATRSSTLF